MSTRHLVDPEVAPILELMQRAELNHGNLAEARAARVPIPDDPALPGQAAVAPGRDGAPDVPLLVFNPQSGNRRRAAILHIHGGGMVMGNTDIARLLLPSLLLPNDAVGVSVDYRLAPEAPFPGPQEDCYAGLAWLVAHADALGVDPARIIVMGESAGGGLAAALAQMVRDRGEFSLAAQVLIYPMIDHRTGSPEAPVDNPATGEFIWTRAFNQFGWACLRGDYGLDDARLGWFSPSRAGSLAALPPTFLATGALDLFLEENLDYARRLIAAGVPTELHVYPGAIHAFQFAQGARVSQQADRDLKAAVGRFLG
ncbi:MAG: alpha/beta hydrolase [Caulobacteraceae bacterium]|nr:alpha/beta hydrolase [Caulobacteraceae bacterium]